MNPPLPCKSTNGCNRLLPASVADDGLPFTGFTPELIEVGFGAPALRWATSDAGTRMAVAFAALGFTISEHETHYLMPLDTVADRRLLQLYDLIATLRWRQPYRQLALTEVADA